MASMVAAVTAMVGVSTASDDYHAASDKCSELTHTFNYIAFGLIALNTVGNAIEMFTWVEASKLLKPRLAEGLVGQEMLFGGLNFFQPQNQWIDRFWGSKNVKYQVRQVATIVFFLGSDEAI